MDLSRPRPEPVVRRPVTAAELLARGDGGEWLTASGLEAWLLEQGLAERNGGPGLLVPTRRAFELVGALG